MAMAWLGRAAELQPLLSPGRDGGVKQHRRQCGRGCLLLSVEGLASCPHWRFSPYATLSASLPYRRPMLSPTQHPWPLNLQFASRFVCWLFVGNPPWCLLWNVFKLPSPQHNHSDSMHSQPPDPVVGFCDPRPAPFGVLQYRRPICIL